MNYEIKKGERTMKKYKVFLMLVIIVIAMSNVCISNTLNDSVINKKQLSLREFQIEQMKEYQNNLLSTVRWTIGIVVMVLLFLISYSWYTNFKVSEKEIEIIKRQMQNYIDEKMNVLKSNTKKYITDNIDIKVNQLDSSLKTIKNNLYDLEMEFTEYKADQSNSIFLYVKPLEHAIKNDSNWQISRILDRIKTKLNKNPKLNAEDTSDLNGVFEKLPSKYKTEVGLIESMMNKS